VGLAGAAPLAAQHKVRSRDAGVLRDAVADLAVGHDVIPRGSFLDGIVNGTGVGSVNLVFVRYGGPVVVEAPATDTRVAVTVPLGPMEVRRHDARTIAGEGFVLADDRPTVMRPDPYAGAVVIAADRALLDRAVTRLTGVRHSPVEFGPGWRDSVMPASMMDATWRHVGAMLAAGASTPPAVVKALESMLVDAILLSTPHSHSALLAAPRADAPGHAERIRGWLEDHYVEPVTVTELAAGVGLSVRQVQEVVRTAFGTTPSRLLREIRLERARVLLRSGAVATVSQAAAESGFAHLGRFAAAYRERFGELPSTTR
jgi:AraC-like DNA-binding protein